jgi:glycosyltransferase involved in cell wall biosynthesis
VNSCDLASSLAPISNSNKVPLVSVIMPAYNAERYVLEAVRSVLDQDYQPVEIVLIDDGSTDNTVELVRREAPQARIIQQANSGVAAARNTGLQGARGELLCFLDADDGWFPGKLRAQVDYLQRHPQVGLVFHRWGVWKPDEQGVYHPPTEWPVPIASEIDPAQSGWIYPQLLLNCIVHTSTVMMRREVFEKIGFFETTLINGEDYHYWLRVSRKYEMHQLAGIYSFYRIVGGSLTNNAPKPKNYEYYVVKGAIDQWGLSSPHGASLPQALASQRLGKLAFDYGYQHFHGGSPTLARQAFWQTLRHQPWRWRALPYWLASLGKELLGWMGKESRSTGV